jgi:hypothetical protein
LAIVVMYVALDPSILVFGLFLLRKLLQMG